MRTRSQLLAIALAGSLLLPPAPAAGRVQARCGSGLSQHDVLAFVRAESMRTDIWMMRGDGSGLRRLTRSGTDSGPELSPRGDRIAFESRRDGNGEIYVMNADGSGARNLTRTPDIREAEPTWSPDGRRIAFHSTPITAAELDNPDVEVIDAKTRRRQNLTNTPLVKEVKPAWAPNGRWIAFEAGEPALSTAAPNDDIWVMNFATGERRRLTTHPGREWFPAWSPDSRRIAFMSGRDGNFEIYVMNADGSAQARLTSNDTYDAHPAWSPNGSRIVYSRLDSILIPLPGVFVAPNDPTVGDLVSVRPDGAGTVALTQGGIHASPDYRACREASGPRAS